MGEGGEGRRETTRTFSLFKFGKDRKRKKVLILFKQQSKREGETFYFGGKGIV